MSRGPQWAPQVSETGRRGAIKEAIKERLSWDVAEEGRALSRRGPRGGDLDGESQVGEDLPNDAGIGNGREQAHAAPTAGAGQDIQVEGPCMRATQVQ